MNNQNIKSPADVYPGQWEVTGGVCRPKNPRQLTDYRPHTIVELAENEKWASFRDFAATHTYPSPSLPDRVHEAAELSFVWQYQNELTDASDKWHDENNNAYRFGSFEKYTELAVSHGFTTRLAIAAAPTEVREVLNELDAACDPYVMADNPYQDAAVILSKQTGYDIQRLLNNGYNITSVVVIEAIHHALSEKQKEVDGLREALPKWIDISDFPKNINPTVLRWHKIWKCLVSVKHRLGYVDNGCEWIDGTHSNTWPEAAFSPLFQYMPDWDNYSPEALTTKQQ